jgi:hypothetical protein
MLTSQLPRLAGVPVLAVMFATLSGAQTKAGYTVSLQEVLTTRRGASSVVSVEVQAQRDDGATVLQLGPHGETARHIRLPGGRLIETNDRDKRMSTFEVPPDRVTGSIRDPYKNCSKDREEFRGEELIGGFRAARIVSASGGSVRWYALDHSCALVRSVMEHPGGSTSEKILVTLVPGSPAESLFQTDGYVEGPPSALSGATSCDASCEQWRKRRDAEYYRLRRR